VFVFLPIVTDILVVITQILDIFAVTIVAISVFQAIVFSTLKRSSFPFSYFFNHSGNQDKIRNDSKIQVSKVSTCTRNLIGGLLLALEFESASAIIKLGIFMTNATLLDPIGNNINNFLFFVSILTLRIIINQSLRRFNIVK